MSSRENRIQATHASFALTEHSASRGLASATIEGAPAYRPTE